MLETTIKVATGHFDGPLSLLLLLVQKEQMDLGKLDLTIITQQYLDYLQIMRDLNFDIAGDYLYLAATLVFLKSQSCLQEEEVPGNHLAPELIPGITTAGELIRRLEELQHFQKLGQKIWALPKRGHEIFLRPKVNKKAIVNSILQPMDLLELTKAMMAILQRENRSFTVIERDRISIRQKLLFLKTILPANSTITFAQIFLSQGDTSLLNKVVIFISLLELARLKKIHLFQQEDSGELYIEVLESLENFDVDLANGFEDPNSESKPGHAAIPLQ